MLIEMSSACQSLPGKKHILFRSPIYRWIWVTWFLLDSHLPSVANLHIFGQAKTFHIFVECSLSLIPAVSGSTRCLIQSALFMCLTFSRNRLTWKLAFEMVYACVTHAFVYVMHYKLYWWGLCCCLLTVCLTELFVCHYSRVFTEICRQQGEYSLHFAVK